MTAATAVRVRRAPASWTRQQRAALSRELAVYGVGLTELSDARELLGFERLSEASEADRELAVQNLGSPDLVVALQQVRSCRAWLFEQLAEVDDQRVAEIKRAIGLGRKAITALRLGELSALVGYATEPAPRAIRPVETTPTWTEEELFGAFARDAAR